MAAFKLKIAFNHCKKNPKFQSLRVSKSHSLEISLPRSKVAESKKKVETKPPPLLRLITLPSNYLNKRADIQSVSAAIAGHYNGTFGGGNPNNARAWDSVQGGSARRLREIFSYPRGRIQARITDARSFVPACLPRERCFLIANIFRVLVLTYLLVCFQGVEIPSPLAVRFFN